MIYNFTFDIQSAVIQVTQATLVSLHYRRGFQHYLTIFSGYKGAQNSPTFISRLTHIHILLNMPSFLDTYDLCSTPILGNVSNIPHSCSQICDCNRQGSVRQNTPLLDRLIAPQTKLPLSTDHLPNGTQRFITAFARARQLSIPAPNLQSKTTQRFS